MRVTSTRYVAIVCVLLAAAAVLFGPAIERDAVAQPMPPPPPLLMPQPMPAPPIFNPSTPYTAPTGREVPVSPGLPGSPGGFHGGAALGAELPSANSPCSVLGGRPCFPQNLPPLGQELRLTVVSTDDDAAANKPDSGDAKNGGDANKPADEKPLSSISEMYAALRACWMPPPKDEARHGMEYTILFAFKRDGTVLAPPRRTYSSRTAPPEVRDAYRDAVDAALKRCAPLHFSTRMGGAVAGRPIAMRFVDERTLANSIDNTAQ